MTDDEMWKDEIHTKSILELQLLMQQSLIIMRSNYQVSYMLGIWEH